MTQRVRAGTALGSVRPFIPFAREEVFEYRGARQRVQGAWEIKTDGDGHLARLATRPWLEYMVEDSDDPHERLSHEIRAFEAYMRLTPAEESASSLVFSELSAALEPRYHSILIGSRSTGLATPISDLDVSIGLKRHNPAHQWEDWSVESKAKQRRGTTEMLTLLREILRASEGFSSATLVHARVPIVRAKHIATDLEIQLQIMMTNGSQQAFTRAYLEDYPSLRPLYVCLRYALEIRNLTQVYEGGLGSYSLLIMIVTALKYANDQFASKDLARQLLHILKFWATANLYDNGYSTNPLGLFAKKQGSSEEQWTLTERLTRSRNAQLSSIDKMNKYNPQKPYLLCLQDPASYDNDLGKNTYAIKHIQATFASIHDKILKVILEMPLVFVPKNRRSRSLLGPLVQADYTHFEQHRSRVERYSMPTTRRSDDYHSRRTMEDAAERAKGYKERHSAEVKIRYFRQNGFFRKYRSL
ncbi:MAG: hypothetical protein Q9217_005658 [Psora testacea]